MTSHSVTTLKLKSFMIYIFQRSNGTKQDSSSDAMTYNVPSMKKFKPLAV